MYSISLLYNPSSAELLQGALTMPDVTELLSWNGLPKATTHSPGRISLDLPIFIVGRFFWKESTCIAFHLASNWAQPRTLLTLHGLYSLETSHDSLYSVVCALISYMNSQLKSGQDSFKDWNSIAQEIFLKYWRLTYWIIGDEKHHILPRLGWECFVKPWLLHIQIF